MMNRRNWIRLGLLAALLALGSGCATTDWVTGKRVRNMYSPEEEVQAGGQYFAQNVGQLKKQNVPINQDPDRVALVRGITADIIAVAHNTNLPYKATYVGAPEVVNACAFPGGNVMVYEGILDRTEGLVRTQDELAAVIAHEIAHVNCRHSTEAMTRQVVPNVLLSILMIWATVKDKDELQLLAGGLMLLHNGLVVTKYSRRDEFEADRVGMLYMAQAGYDPEAAPRIWERVAKASDRQLANPLSIFSTHPRDDLRAVELRKHLPEARAFYNAAPVKRDGSRDITRYSKPRSSSSPSSRPR